MQKLIAFNHLSLDGYFTDRTGDMSWAHGDPNDPEWAAFVKGNASGDGTLVFGRKTYELMASYWPTPLATKNNPVIAGHMNRHRKVVFSRSLGTATWENTKLVKGDLSAAIHEMKNEPGDGMAILGSGSIVSQLAQAGLIDEFHVVLTPVVLGAGRTTFEGVEKLPLKLISSRTFGNGNVLLCYKPAA